MKERKLVGSQQLLRSKFCISLRLGLWTAVALGVASCSTTNSSRSSLPKSTTAETSAAIQKPSLVGKGPVEARPKASSPQLRNPHHALLGKWIDQDGTVYRFQQGGKVTWSHPFGDSYANFQGKYTLTEGLLVIIPQSAGSADQSLGKQLKGVKSKHRLTQYTVEWQGNGSLILQGPDAQLSLLPVN